jgi:transposase InsO family protein
MKDLLVPYVPLSHPFVERLIGTTRREFLDHTLFWNARDLERKLGEFKEYYNEHRVHVWVANYNFRSENRRLRRLAPEGALPYASPHERPTRAVLISTNSGGRHMAAGNSSSRWRRN